MVARNFSLPANTTKTFTTDLVSSYQSDAHLEPLHVGKPNIGDRKRLFERINEMLDNRWLTNRGPFLREFEARLAEYCQVKHCIAMCNGTIALEIIIRALEMKGEVIVPSFTFVATAHALQWQEITPVFCDIDPITHTIDPAQIRRLITPRTTGIIGVHIWGHACPVDEIAEIAQEHNLKVIYDAAHALSCTYKGRMIGRFGDAEVLSFHATKFLNSFEGGAVLTNSDEVAEKTRLMQNFGFSGYDNVIYIGTNGKMSEISAIMGLTNLESIDEFIDVNKCNYDLYRTALSEIPGIHLVEHPAHESNNYQYIILDIDEQITGVSRDEIVRKMHDLNILCRRYFHPGCHKMEPYRSYFPNAGLLLTVTEKLTERVISLPTGTSMGETEIFRICTTLRSIIAEAKSMSRNTD